MTYLLRLSLKSQSRRLICLILIANIYQFHSSASSTKAEKICKTHLFNLPPKIEFVRLIRSICNSKWDLYDLPIKSTTVESTM